MSIDPLAERLTSRYATNGHEPAIDGGELTAWEPVDLGPVIRGECSTPPPSVLSRCDGICLFYSGKLNLLMGESESFKTWIALLAVTQELAAGHHVIYVDYEDSPQTCVERLRALGATAEQIGSLLTYINPAGSFGEFAVDWILGAVEDKGAPSLAVIDGVSEAMGLMGLNPLDNSDIVTYYGSSPKWLARKTGAAVAMIDHVTKSREGRGRWAIGGERKISGLDGAAYGLDMITPFGRGKTGSVKITVSKDRLGFVRKYEDARKVISIAELKSWPDGGVTISLDIPEPASADGSFRPTYLMGKLSEAITETLGLSGHALRGKVKGNHDARTLALETLVIEGYVSVATGPRGARLYNSVRPFRAAKAGDPDEVF